MSEKPHESPSADEVTSDEVAAAQRRRMFFGNLCKWLIVLAAGLLFSSFLVTRSPPCTRISSESTRRAVCRNQMLEIGIALALYHAEHGCLPPAYTVDANGRPLHSWRTLILPFMEYEHVYRQIDLSKPWDHPDNRKALQMEVDVYRCPSVEDAPPGHTTYLAVVSDKSYLQPGKPRKRSPTDDPSSLTIVLVDVDAQNAVPWMAPRDASEDLVLRMLKSGRPHHRDKFQALFANGSVRLIGQEVDSRTLRALMTATGHDDEGIDPDSF